MDILKKLKYRYHQFRNEVEGLISELQILIVSLFYLNKLELVEVSKVFLILDCHRDALIMRTFCFFRILPRYKIAVAEQARDLHILISNNFCKSTRIVLTSRQYIKNYQFLVSLRSENKLVIL
jgi:hypothetical protein